MFEKYQETITRKEFSAMLDKVYNPSKAIYGYLNVTDDYVEFFDDLEKSRLDFTLRLAGPGQTPKEARQTFKTVPELRRLRNPATRPLAGIRIALDPGHIGGKWADIEDRCVIWGNHPVIREGDQNLKVAHHLKSRLEAAGAEIYMTHTEAIPVTPLRTKDFMEEARQAVYAKYNLDEEKAEKRRAHYEAIIRWRADLYFYRRAEIAQRAENLRAHFLADITICNHFNATERSGAREIVKDNRHAFFINGCYGADEIVNPATRFFLFSKLLERPLDIEMAVAGTITTNMLGVAKLPPVKYGREKYQCRVNANSYLYARNLAASRQYPGPCIILEPFYMNNEWTAARLAAGDYDGTREVAGGKHRSLPREYADAVADAIIATYSNWTTSSKPNLADRR